DGPGSIRQRLEVETERIARGNQSFAVNSGLRINVYQPQLKNESDQPARAARLFRYGERLRFPAKIFASRNCRNPGAFDYRGYLAENGIVALASAKSSSVEVLPGFVGSRTEFWRARVHRSIIDKVHALWPPREAALMDAMVIGEDAFINRPTRADFQRSGTYHVLVVSGMNVSILALVTFWFLRWLRISDLLAGAITVALMMSYAWLGHPRFAVISVGARNTYGHPRGEVLNRLGQARVLTYRTDLDGAVTFYLDGKAVISGLPRAEVH
ncbi:MAG: ComEC/Rec2 family competence protein, partial [Terriglobales bacterium]